MKRSIVMLALAVIATARMSPPTAAQSPRPADLAGKLTGKWKLNAELTPASPRSGRGRGQAAFAASLAPTQRGGGGRGTGAGGGRGEASSPLTAEETAAQTALSILREVPVEITIDASAEAVTFRDPRGEWQFKIDDKNSTMDVPGGKLRVKSKWDRGALRQEFSSAQRQLVKTWSIDANDRLVLVEKVESVGFRSESKVVFDRI